WEPRRARTCWRRGRSRSQDRRTSSRQTTRCAPRTWGIDVQQFFQTLVSGLAQGSIYGSLALALVLIYKATEVINFAQGEMAMFSTYIAWALQEHRHLSYWRAFSLPLAIAFAWGFA